MENQSATHGIPSGWKVLFRSAASLLCLLGLVVSGGISPTTAMAEEPSAVFTSGALLPKHGDVAVGNDYGVFLGLDSDRMEILFDYSTVVIDAQYYTAEEIAELKQAGLTVYSYLNIGSIEKFRPGYAKFKKKTLGKYAGWPGEYWMSPARQSWRNFIYAEAKALVAKDIDGFFLDNADVYAKYRRTRIFNGLVKIFKKLNTYDLPIVVNGGDVFIKKAFLNPKKPKIKLTAVNQEDVFSRVTSKGVMTTQTAKNTKYYTTYLTKCANAGLTVYLLEYVDIDNAELREIINDYCAETGYICYIASSRELDG